MVHMRKVKFNFLKFLLVFSLVAGLFTPFAEIKTQAADGFDSNYIIYDKIKHTDVPIYIDGIKDMHYDGTLMLNTNKQGYVSNMITEGDAQATFLFDDSGLYVYAEIKDSSENSGDGFYVYVDFINNHDITGLTGSDYINENRDISPVSDTWAGDSNGLGWIGVNSEGNGSYYQGFWKSGNVDKISKATGTKLKNANGNVVGYTAEMYFPFPANFDTTKIGIGIEVYNDTGSGSVNIKHDTAEGNQYHSNYEVLPDYEFNNYDITYVNPNDVLIDGVKDEAYGGGLYREDCYSWYYRDEDDVLARAWFLTDSNGLYVFGEAIDTTKRYINHNNLDSGDVFKFYFDFINNHNELGLTGAAYYNTGTSGSKKLGTVSIGYDGTISTSHGFEDITIESATYQTEKGYNVEFYIPFPEKTSDNIGIGFEFKDDANGGGLVDTPDEMRFDSDWGLSYWSKMEVLSDFTWERTTDIKQDITDPIVKPESENNVFSNFDVLFSEDSIMVDGIKDSIYDNSLMLSTDYEFYGNSSNAEGYTKAWFVIDENYLYVYAEVEDSTYNDFNGSSSKRDGDMVQIYVDFVNDHDARKLGYNSTTNRDDYMMETSYWEANKKLGFVSMGGDGTYFANYGFWEIPMAVEGRRTQSGYAVEGRIPLPEDCLNEYIGLGIETHDDIDGDGSRDGVRYDRENGSTYWSNYASLANYRIDPGEDKYDIVYSSEKIQIDGVKDAAYNKSLMLENSYAWSGNSSNAEGQTKAWFMVDDGGMYVYAEVVDHTYHKFNGSSSNRDGDMVQINIDFVNDHSYRCLQYSSDNSKDYLYQTSYNEANKKLGYVMLGADGTYFGNMGWWQVPITVAGTKTATGYTVEGYIPFPESGCNKVIGLGFETHDDVNGDGIRDGIRYDKENGGTFYYDYAALPDYTVQKNTNILAKPGAYDIAYSVSGIKIDGIKDVDYYNSVCISTYIPRFSDTMTLNENLSKEGYSKTWLSADDEGLYIYAEVTDNTYYDFNGSSNKRDGDMITFYLDFGNDHESRGLGYNTSTSTDDYLMQTSYWEANRKLGFVSIGGDGTYFANFGFWELPLTVEGRRTNEGYAVEGYIPFPENMTNKVIGIGVQTNNDTNGDGISDITRYDSDIGLTYWSNYSILKDYVIQSTTNSISCGNDDNLKINKIGVSQFKIVYPNENHWGEKQAAIKLANYIKKNYGITVSVVSDIGMCDGFEIIIGNSSHVTQFMRNKSYNASNGLVNTTNSIIVSGDGWVWIDAKNNFTISDTVDKFIADIAPCEYSKTSVSYNSVQNSVKVSTTINEEPLKLMDYNIRNDGRTTSRVNDVISTINYYSPDVLGTQEANDSWKTIFNDSGLSSTYGYVGSPRGIYTGDANEYTLVLYNKNKFNLIESGTKWLSYTPDKPSYIDDAQYPRTMTYLVLERKSDGLRFMTVNCHLSWDVSSESRPCVEQTNIMMNLTNQILARVGDMPVYFTGDFNTTPFTPAYNNMLKSGYSDVRYCADETTDNYTFENGNTFDYFFISQNDFSIKKFVVDHERTGSDHFPVYVEAYISNRGCR